MKYDVIIELNLSFKNSHIGGACTKKIRALVGDHSMKSDVIIELNLSFKNSHIGGLHKKIRADLFDLQGYSILGE